MTDSTADGGSMFLTSSEFGSGLLWRDAQSGALGAAISDYLGLYLSGGPAGILVDVRRSGKVAIGGGFPSPAYTVSVPNLDVQGTINIGYSRVFQSFPLDSFNAGCLTFGGNPCWSGTRDAVCPVGTKVIGGGMTGVFGSFSSVAMSYPVSDTRWRCGSAYHQSGRSEFCYAICADVD